MDTNRSWRKLFAWRPGPAATEGKVRDRESLSTYELREHCLRRLLSQGMPIWSEEPEHCDGCGRELLLGERARLMCRDDELLLACPLCAQRLLGKGYLAVSADAQTDAPGQGRLSLAG